MYNFFFGKKKKEPEEPPLNLPSKISPLVSTEKENQHNKNRSTERKKKTRTQAWANEKAQSDSCSEDEDPGLDKASAVTAKLSSIQNLECLDPNSMMPLWDVNEKLVACDVCARMFSPRRIATHQDICKRLARKEAENQRRWGNPSTTKKDTNVKPTSKTKTAPHMKPASGVKNSSRVKPASTLPLTSRTKPASSGKHVPNFRRLQTVQDKLPAMSPLHPSPVKPENTPSYEKQQPPSAIKTQEKPVRVRPRTAKPDLNELSKAKVPPAGEQASKTKRPLSAMPSMFPKMFARGKMEVDERETCPSCQRKFNRTSAAHHIPWCTRQAKLLRPPKPPPRKKYVVPKLCLVPKDEPSKPEKIQGLKKVAENLPKSLPDRSAISSKIFQSAVNNAKPKSNLSSRTVPLVGGQHPRGGRVIPGSERDQVARRTKPQTTDAPRTPTQKHHTSRYSYATNGL